MYSWFTFTCCYLERSCNYCSSQMSGFVINQHQVEEGLKTTSALGVVLFCCCSAWPRLLVFQALKLKCDLFISRVFLMVQRVRFSDGPISCLCPNSQLWACDADRNKLNQDQQMHFTCTAISRLLIKNHGLYCYSNFDPFVENIQINILCIRNFLLLFWVPFANI